MHGYQLRIKALLRRPGAVLGTMLTAGSLSFDSIAREAVVAGRRLDLSRQELALLEQLMRRLAPSRAAGRAGRKTVWLR